MELSSISKVYFFKLGSRYFDKYFTKDRHFEVVDKTELIEYYNSSCIYRAERQMISQVCVFELVEVIRRGNLAGFEGPVVVFL